MIVRYATLSALHDCLVSFEPHILHVSSHGGPGTLSLEDGDGRVHAVDSDEFARTVLAGAKPPELVCLAAYYTSAQAAPGMPSFADKLIENGVTSVVGTQTSVTDRFSTLFFAQLYGHLAASSPDVARATADARRAVQARLSGAAEPRERRIALLDEWAIVTLSSVEDAPALSARPGKPTTSGTLPSHFGSASAPTSCN